MMFRPLVLAGIATMLAVLSQAAAQAPVAKAPEQCMTDDGYGRYRPCDSAYMQQNPNWRDTDHCMTDDGYGRYRPCDAGLKQKAQPQK